MGEKERESGGLCQQLPNLPYLLASRLKVKFDLLTLWWLDGANER